MPPEAWNYEENMLNIITELLAFLAKILATVILAAFPASACNNVFTDLIGRYTCPLCGEKKFLK